MWGSYMFYEVFSEQTSFIMLSLQISYPKQDKLADLLISHLGSSQEKLPFLAHVSISVNGPRKKWICQGVHL